MPAWRNWQTRWTQNPVAARPCGFEPLRRQVFGFPCEQTGAAHSLSSVCACMKAGEPQCSLVNGKNGQQRESEPREFVTTRWSLIVSAAHLGSEEQRARDALAELCRTYWRPIFLFV